MKTIFLPLFSLFFSASLLLWSCDSSQEKRTAEDSAATGTATSPRTGSVPDGDEFLITSPTETPLNMEQVFSYESEAGELLTARYAFDEDGLGIATLEHPAAGKIIALQDGEAAANNINYKSSSGVIWNVQSTTATLHMDEGVTHYTLIK